MQTIVTKSTFNSKNASMKSSSTTTTTTTSNTNSITSLDNTSVNTNEMSTLSYLISHLRTLQNNFFSSQTNDNLLLCLNTFNKALNGNLSILKQEKSLLSEKLNDINISIENVKSHYAQCVRDITELKELNFIIENKNNEIDNYIMKIKNDIKYVKLVWFLQEDKRDMYFVGEKRNDNYVNEELHDKLKYVNRRVGYSKQLNIKRNKVKHDIWNKIYVLSSVMDKNHQSSKITKNEGTYVNTYS